MHPGDKVRFVYEAGRLIISPVNRRTYRLQDLLAMQGEAPLAVDPACEQMPASGPDVSW